MLQLWNIDVIALTTTAAHAHVHDKIKFDVILNQLVLALGYLDQIDLKPKRPLPF